MQNIKIIATTAFLFSCCLQVCAQTVSVGNVWAEVQDQQIAVHYTLASEQPADLSLQYSIDNKRTWFNCKSVSGDLQSQTTGNKTILWDCRQDGFEKGNLFFQVVVNKRSKSISKKNVFGLDLGIGARKVNEWGVSPELGIRYTHHFSPSIAWDIVNLKMQIPLKKELSLKDGLFQAMTGLRMYAPTIKGYASLKAGYGNQPALAASGFACELETGIHLTKTLFTGLVYNSQNLQGKWEGDNFNFNSSCIGLRIGLNF